MEKDNVKMPLVANTSFDISLFEIILPLLSGGQSTLLDNDSIKDIENLKNHLKVNNSFHAVPALMNYVTDNIILSGEKDSFSHMQNIFIGGDKVPTETLNKLKDTFSSSNINILYGPTETTVFATANQFKADTKEIINGTYIGKPISNTQIYILNILLQPVPIGIMGKIYISGIGVTRGYLNQEELTAEKFIVNPFIEGSRMYDTGDLGRWLSDGSIEFMGRKDHQVKIRGFRIELGEIESCIRDYSDEVNQVIVEPKEVNQERVLVAYFTSDRQVDKSELRYFLENKLPDYMVPNFYIELEKLPLTPNGKIDRKALPEVDGEDLIRKHYVAPRTATEERLAQIWQEVLGVEKIGVTDDFFELGGHSLIVAQVINRTHKQLGKTVSFKVFFANPTIEGLNKELADSVFSSIPQAVVSASYPVTASQRRLWILSQLEGGSLAYNMPAAIKLTGHIDEDKFEESFRLLIARHEILRTYIKSNDQGDLRQYIVPFEEIDFKISKEDFSLSDNREEAVALYLNQKTNEVFDLERAPLLRASLLRLDTDQYVFFLTLHHIIGDGWSIELLISEIIKTYNALLDGNTFDLPDLRIQYKDYAVWLNTEQQQQKNQKSEAYWLGQFRGELPVLELPTFKKRPLVQTYNGNSINHQFSKSFLEKLKNFSKDHDVTLFMTLMSGINILLHRYTGQDDIIIGTPIAGRDHPDLENQLGLYLNTLAIRTRFEHGDSFIDLIKSQRDTLLEAYEHQGYPFDALVSKLNLKRDTSRSVLFDVLVVLQNQSQLNNIDNEELSGLEVSDYDFQSKISQFDLSFAFIETEGLDLTIGYNTDIYDNFLIERIFTHFENILTQSIENPETKI